MPLPPWAAPGHALCVLLVPAPGLEGTGNPSPCFLQNYLCSSYRTAWGRGEAIYRHSFIFAEPLGL